MKYVKLGNSDLQVSRLCVGCMSFGDPASKMHAWTSILNRAEIVKCALDLGLTFLTQQTPIQQALARNISRVHSKSMLPAIKS